MTFQVLPVFMGDVANWARNVTHVVNKLLDGKLNSTGAVTLTNSVTTTTVKDKRCSVFSTVLLTPTNSAAAGVIASTYAVAGDEQFIITHTSLGTTRTFNYVLIG